VLVREALAPLAFVLGILATNYALAFIPNVKLFDLLVFVAGYTLGLRRGATVAVAAWLVYGNFNPWGPTTGPLLLTVTTSETAYALAGAGARWLLPPSRVRLGPGWATLLFGAAALVATALYDVAANVYTGVAWAGLSGGGDVARWIWVALTNPGALFFYFMHIGSNVAFFATLGPGLVKAAERGKEAIRWAR
jgi:hypothetical protein